MRQRIQAARQRIASAKKTQKQYGPPLEELQVRELAYLKARDALAKEEKEDKKRSWLEPTRTLLYTETGAGLCTAPLQFWCAGAALEGAACAQSKSAQGACLACPCTCA